MRLNRIYELTSKRVFLFSVEQILVRIKRVHELLFCGLSITVYQISRCRSSTSRYHCTQSYRIVLRHAIGSFSVEAVGDFVNRKRTRNGF